ncbi:MAG: OmpH family outer membrane protein [Paludibacteraceae bacterium]|nr:OmpH family outer membrane protein [Paludibacteraceae bacterium]
MKYFNSLCVAVIAFAILSFYGCKGNQSSQESGDSSSVEAGNVVDSASVEPSSVFPVAYVDVDSLLLEYDFAKELNEVLLKRQEKSRKELTNAQMKFQKDYEAFQKKYQAGGFLTEATLQSEQNNLLKQDQELQLLEKKLAKELMDEQQKMNVQLRDTVAAFFKVYNADKRFKLILSNANSDNVLFADEALNITHEVVEQLNLRYAAQQKTK